VKTSSAYWTHSTTTSQRGATASSKWISLQLPTLSSTCLQNESSSNLSLSGSAPLSSPCSVWTSSSNCWPQSFLRNPWYSWGNWAFFQVRCKISFKWLGRLGLHSLIYPFKWCLALIPILPRPLIEVLEAPLPILVGITNQMYRDTTLSEEERKSKIWVFLDTATVDWSGEPVKAPKFRGLRKEIIDEYN